MRKVSLYRKILLTVTETLHGCVKKARLMAKRDSMETTDGRWTRTLNDKEDLMI